MPHVGPPGTDEATGWWGFPAREEEDRQMTGAAMGELSRVLGRERELLELLVVRSGRGEAVAVDLHGSLGSFELHRAITAREVAAELGLPGDATLEQLADAAPPQWQAVLRSHLRALRALAAADGPGAPPALQQRSLRDFLA
jgi:hypothetical protein